MLLYKLLKGSTFVKYLLNGLFRTLGVIILFNLFYLYFSYEFSLLFSLLIVMSISFIINIIYVFSLPLKKSNFFIQIIISVIYYYSSIGIINLLIQKFEFSVRISQLISVIVLFPLSFLLTYFLFKLLNRISFEKN
jgi:hypothetical protein